MGACLGKKYNIGHAFTGVAGIQGGAGKIEEIDAMRGFAIICVLLVHTAQVALSMPGLHPVAFSNFAVCVVALVAIPLFTFISGAVLGAKYRGHFNLLKFYAKRAPTFVPYLVFSAAYIALSVTLGGAEMNFERMLKTVFLFQSYDPSIYSHLWFFGLLLQLYLLYPLLEKIYGAFESRGLVHPLLGACVLAQIAWNVFINATGISTDVRAIPEFLFYVVLGIHFGRNWLAFRGGSKKIPVRTLALSAFALTAACIITTASNLKEFTYFVSIPPERTFPLYIMAPALYVTIIMMLHKASAALERGSLASRVLLSLGGLSMGIYLTHIIFHFVGIRLLSYAGVGPGDWFFYPVLFGFVAIFAWLSARLLSELPHSDMIIGYRGKRKKA